MESVELHLAFSWICDYCGHRNFERGITLEEREEEGWEYEPLDEEEEDDEYDYVVAPEEVTCENCDATYTVEEGI